MKSIKLKPRKALNKAFLTVKPNRTEIEYFKTNLTQLLNTINEAESKNYVASKRPKDPEIRAQLDFGYSYDGSVIELLEIRPVWDNPKEILKLPFAKIRYYKSRLEWNLYWMRGSGKWELYEPLPTSKQLDKLIETIEEDRFGCFFG